MLDKGRYGVRLVKWYPSRIALGIGAGRGNNDFWSSPESPIELIVGEGGAMRISGLPEFLMARFSKVEVGNVAEASGDKIIGFRIHIRASQREGDESISLRTVTPITT